MTGAVVSTTLKETFALELLPAASVTVTAIVCRPVARSVPAAGFWVTVNWLAGVQLSVATTLGTMLGTAPWQLESAETVIGAGVLTMAGAVVSTTVTAKLVCGEAAHGFVTLTVIVWGPVL